MRHRSAAVLAASTLAVIAAVGQSAPAGADDSGGLADAIDRAGTTPLVYQFGGDAPLPMQRLDGTSYSAAVDARLVVLPHASTSGLVSELLVDKLIGDSSRCEFDPTAEAGGIRQSSETHAPVDAWHRMGDPSFALNANFFDVRPQGDGQSWSDTGCSSPLGTYYDTHLASRSLNMARFWDRYTIGAEGLSDGAGETWSPLSTFVIDDGALLGAPGPARFETLDATSPTDMSAVKSRIDQLEFTGRQFAAFAGLKLIGSGAPFEFVDDPVRFAARSGVGYDANTDRLYLFQGGSGESDGLTVGNVQDLFRGLGATMAVGLDGGGSSAMVVDRRAPIVWAGSGVSDGRAPVGSCPNEPNAYCSPGAARPVPGWLGVHVN